MGGCGSEGINKQILYPKKSTWNPDEALLSLGKNGGKSMLSAGNTQQKVEGEDCTKDENIQCRVCHPEGSPIIYSEYVVVKLSYY